MKTALVLGDSRDVMAEAAAALDLFTPDMIVATNHIGRVWDGNVDIWVSNHAENFPAWVRDRSAAGLPDAGSLATTMHAPVPADLDVVKIQVDVSDSGLLAVMAAIGAGCETIVLAGIPLTNDAGRFYEEGDFRDAPAYQKNWEARAETLKPLVRSMSGWTREFFGAPDKDWVKAKSHRNTTKQSQKEESRDEIS